MEDITTNITYQHQDDYPHLTVQTCGLFISKNSSWLAATPDGAVPVPSAKEHPNGLLDKRNPFSVSNKSIEEATSSFCLVLDKKRHRHSHYFQVQCLYTVYIILYTV